MCCTSILEMMCDLGTTTSAKGRGGMWNPGEGTAT